MSSLTTSPEIRAALDAAWVQHRADLAKEEPQIQPLWWVLGWSLGLPALVYVLSSYSSVVSLLWWGIFGYLLITTYYGYWREKALAGCYIRMSDAFANYVIENDDLAGALAWHEALVSDKRRLKILRVPFPTLKDRDEAADREVGF